LTPTPDPAEPLELLPALLPAAADRFIALALDLGFETALVGASVTSGAVTFRTFLADLDVFSPTSPSPTTSVLLVLAFLLLGEFSLAAFMMFNLSFALLVCFAALVLLCFLLLLSFLFFLPVFLGFLPRFKLLPCLVRIACCKLGVTIGGWLSTSQGKSKTLIAGQKLKNENSERCFFENLKNIHERDLA
jgi:hypothetical protein